MLVENELLTPQGLVDLLKQQFQLYRDERKLDSLKDDTVATSWIKQKAAAAYESTLEHKALTDFVIRQMDEILAEAGSQEKKMTDLTILFYGLYNYMTLERHSSHLSPKLEIVRQRLWAGTPHHEVQLAPEGYESVAAWQEARNAALVAVPAEIADPAAREEALAPIFSNPLAVKVVYADEDQFKQNFDVQILRAQDLMRCNTTEKDQAVFAHYKKLPTDAYTVVKLTHSLDSKHNITPAMALILHYPTWHYRVAGEANNQVRHAALAEIHTSLRGAFRGTKEQVAFASVQWAVEEPRPFPNMGVTYHHRLAELQLEVDAAAQAAAALAQVEAARVAAEAEAEEARVAAEAARVAAEVEAARVAAEAEAARVAAAAPPAVVPVVAAPAPAAGSSLKEKAASVFARFAKKKEVMVVIPAADPVVAAPAADPVVAAPAADPVVVAPAADPVVAPPAAAPVVAPPVPAEARDDVVRNKALIAELIKSRGELHAASTAPVSAALDSSSAEASDEEEKKFTGSM